MVATPADGSISVLVVRALMAGAAFHGIEPRALAEQSGIPASLLEPAQLADPDARVPARVALELWELLPKLTQNDRFGLWLAELVGAAPLTVAGWFILSSSNLREGVNRAIRFQRLLHDRAMGELEESEQGCTYVHRVGDATFRAPRHAIEFGFAQMVLLARRATGRDVAPASVQFQHARPPDTDHHRRLFGPQVTFNAQTDAITFDRATCELPVVGADPALGELVAAHARTLLERLPEDSSWTARVERVVAAELPRTLLSVESAAAALSLTKRTLQRRLQEESTSFEEIVDRLRQRLAERYLREQRMGVQEAAFLLGYSDVSAFHRAFSRWTGMSPTAFRTRAQ